jgi:hypothetical protein
MGNGLTCLWETPSSKPARILSGKRCSDNYLSHLRQCGADIHGSSDEQKEHVLLDTFTALLVHFHCKTEAETALSISRSEGDDASCLMGHLYGTALP